MKPLKNLRIWFNKRITNIPGWRTSEKLVLFESDDWGSIRLPSVEVLQKLHKKGININDAFSYNDSLETTEDLEKLFCSLMSVRDSNGNYPIISANCIVANPDFKRIAENEFKEYYYELATETFKRFPQCQGSFKLWQEGIQAKLFYPQYHGREHVNAIKWLKKLNSDDWIYKYAFSNETYAIPYSKIVDNRKNWLAILDYDDEIQKQYAHASLVDGLKQFESIFGFRSISFTPPCYVWDKDVEALLSVHNIKFMKTSKTQSIPDPFKPRYRKKFHYTGEKNIYGQYYQVRNCYFEPALNKNVNWINACMNSIEVAFNWGKPAIITSHRLNFIGSKNINNRDDNLILLESLLKHIVKKWPDVQFVNSTELGGKILGQKDYWDLVHPSSC